MTRKLKVRSLRNSRRMLRAMFVSVFVLLPGAGIVASSAFGYGLLEGSRPDPTVDDLKTLIFAENLRSIDAVLARMSLDPKWSNHLRQYVLMHESRSLQDASFEYPRVILFGKSARLLIAFNGHPSQKGYDQLELIQFRESPARFEFYEILLPGTPRLADPDGLSHIWMDGARWPDEPHESAVRFSSANPSKCFACHRSPLRPNWDPYPSWKGSYNDDNIVTTHVAELDKFEKVRKTSSRYRYLDPEFYRRQKMFRSVFVHHPSSTFTELLGELNSKRIAGQLVQDPRYQSLRFAIFSRFLNCPDLEERFLPDEIRDQMPMERTYFVKDTKQRLEGLDEKERLIVDDSNFIGGIRYLLENVGIDLSSWSMTVHEPRTYRFTQPLQWENSFRRALWEADPKLRSVVPVSIRHLPYGRDLPRYTGDRLIDFLEGTFRSDKIRIASDFCDHFETASRKIFADERVVATLLIGMREVHAKENMPRAFQKCAACHSKNERNPHYIPFEDGVRFAEYLDSNSNLADQITYAISEDAREMQMPYRERPLSSKERREIVRYLERLKRDGDN